jgi:hypothetical protein
LLESLDAEVDDDAEAAWATEVNRPWPSSTAER